MKKTPSIVRCQVEIHDPCGLGLRAAARFIGTAGRFHSDVWVVHEGRRYNGKSLRELMTLGVECGSRLELQAHGPDAEAAVTALAREVELCPV
jgi:phosphotransferase system HPr (HPr) family protein